MPGEQYIPAHVFKEQIFMPGEQWVPVQVFKEQIFMTGAQWNMCILSEGTVTHY